MCDKLTLDRYTDTFNVFKIITRRIAKLFVRRQINVEMLKAVATLTELVLLDMVNVVTLTNIIAVLRPLLTLPTFQEFHIPESVLPYVDKKLVSIWLDKHVHFLTVRSVDRKLCFYFNLADANVRILYRSDEYTMGFVAIMLQTTKIRHIEMIRLSN